MPIKTRKKKKKGNVLKYHSECLYKKLNVSRQCQVCTDNLISGIHVCLTCIVKI